MAECDQKRGDPGSGEPSLPSPVLGFHPGEAVAGGRYRLLAMHGSRPQLQFWQALDVWSGLPNDFCRGRYDHRRD
jgi:hypothetical protein